MEPDKNSVTDDVYKLFMLVMSLALLVVILVLVFVLTAGRSEDRERITSGSTLEGYMAYYHTPGYFNRQGFTVTTGSTEEGYVTYYYAPECSDFEHDQETLDDTH